MYVLIAGTTRQLLRRLGYLCAFLSVACSSDRVTGQAALTIEAIAGDYVLTRIGDQPLPAQTSGRVTVFAGRLQLQLDSRFQQIDSSEICLFGTCTTGSDTTRGTWLLLQNGGLYFDDERSYSWPPPVVQVDGHEIRFYTAGDGLLDFVYDRQ